MSERRAPRLFLEVAFLAALAAALTFADLERYAIVAVMLLGWMIVVAFEWGALRTRPHYGSGSPPRWYTPPVKLPPPRPLEQFSAGYPAATEAHSDAPTWIASPAMLADWPVSDAEAGTEPVVEEQTYVHDVIETENAIAVAGEEAESGVFELEDETEEAEEPEPERREPQSRRQIEPRPVPVDHRTARHRVDPLATTSTKGKRFGRRNQTVTGDADVPDGPPRRRLLPAQARGED